MLSKAHEVITMQFLHTGLVDLLAACQAFVSVADRGSFTRGAAWVGVSQSVASRRIASLEGRLGGAVLDRSGRAPTLTPLGRHLLPMARRMVAAAEELLLEADEARLSALSLAVPEGCDVRDLAAVELAGRDAETRLVMVAAGPHIRPELLSRGQVAAAVLACPPGETSWRVRLGVARAVGRPGRVHLDELRPGRDDAAALAPRLWLLPEDDVPHVRDALVAAAGAAGLAQSQVAVATSASSALASVLVSEDLVVLSRRDATRLELPWAPLAAPALRRGYALESSALSTRRRLRQVVGAELAIALGVDDGPEAP
jgi:DNA-binding transcriptional LysR family regulator